MTLHYEERKKVMATLICHKSDVAALKKMVNINSMNLHSFSPSFFSLAFSLQ
jgi:hypothetical protein